MGCWVSEALYASFLYIVPGEGKKKMSRQILSVGNCVLGKPVEFHEILISQLENSAFLRRKMVGSCIQKGPPNLAAIS